MKPTKLIYTTTTLFAMVALMGCSQAEQAVTDTANQAKATLEETSTKATQAVSEMAQDVAGKMQRPGADLSALPSGTYKSEQGHTYVAFTYWHQDYAKPILRWRETNATIEFDNENPENSTLNVSIPVASIDSGVDKFDEHLVSADFFDAENYPTITFRSTNINQALLGSGAVTGELTIKGMTKPVTFTGKVNKVGKHFRSGVDMFGISATANVKRSDFGVDAYTPNVGDDVEIMIEAEFLKEE